MNNQVDLKGLRFTCPLGHVVDGIPGQQLPLAIVGTPGSSKSHLLAAMVYDLEMRRALEPVGITLSSQSPASSDLDDDIRRLFEGGQMLYATPMDHLGGPFPYRFSLVNEHGYRQRSLLLFDSPGEAFADLHNLATSAAYVALARAIFLVIDPVGIVPTRFDEGPLTVAHQMQAQAKTLDLVRTMADLLEAVWGRPSQLVDIAVCVVIAKCDSVPWSKHFEWASQFDEVLVAAGSGQLDSGLALSSVATRTAFADLGGARIVSEIEDHFDASRLRYCAASATGQMPGSNGSRWSWEAPCPKGIALAPLQMLNLMGLDC